MREAETTGWLILRHARFERELMPPPGVFFQPILQQTIKWMNHRTPFHSDVTIIPHGGPEHAR
jgi:hypothetical protein